MFDEKMILDRLASGEDPTIIANEFAALLNKSLANLQKEKEEKALEAKKNALAADIADLMMDYIALDKPEMIDLLAKEGVDIHSIMRETMDNTMSMMDSLFDLALEMADEQEDMSAPVEEPTPKVKIVTGKDADRTIHNFLRQFGL